MHDMENTFQTCKAFKYRYYKENNRWKNTYSDKIKFRHELMIKYIIHDIGMVIHIDENDVFMTFYNIKEIYDKRNIFR